MSAQLIFFGLLLGALSSGFNVFFYKGEITNGAACGYLFGGAMGGLLAAACVSEAGGLDRSDIALIGLSGYFVADVFATLMGFSRKGE